MSVQRLVDATASLATSIGPRTTLAAMQEVAGALAELDELLAAGCEGVDSDDELVIDLRAALGELAPVLAGAESRLVDIHSALAGR